MATKHKKIGMRFDLKQMAADTRKPLPESSKVPKKDEQRLEAGIAAAIQANALPIGTRKRLHRFSNEPKKYQREEILDTLAYVARHNLAFTNDGARGSGKPSTRCFAPMASDLAFILTPFRRPGTTGLFYADISRREP
jgi:hypothetical protein